MTAAAFGSFLQFVFLVGSALTAIKLLSTGLYKRYPVLFLYFVFRVPNSIWPFFVGIRTNLYFHLWKYTTIIALLIYIFLIVELYRLVLEKYRGLQTVGRWAMYASLVLSVTISLLTLMPKFNPGMSERNKTLRIIFNTERGIDTALAIFIILLLAFLSRYPIKLSRNVRLHALICAAFFLSNTLGLLMRGLFGLALGETVNLVVTGISACSVLAWLILLNPAGEEVQASQRRLEPDQEKRLLGQLDLLNATLLRASRQAR